MLKQITCRVCRKDFSYMSFFHHFKICPDELTGSWLDHGLETERTTKAIQDIPLKVSS